MPILVPNVYSIQSTFGFRLWLLNVKQITNRAHDKHSLHTLVGDKILELRERLARMTHTVNSST